VRAEDWLEEANRYDAQAKQALAEGRVGDAVVLSVRAEAARDAAEKVRRALTATSRAGKKRAVEAVERLHVSQGKKDQGSFQQAANAAGYTVRSLAQKLRAEGWRVSHPYLRQCLNGEANIRLSLAERVQEVLGKDPAKGWRWAATRKNWPGKAWAKEPDER
jgi:hypothetical protein